MSDSDEPQQPEGLYPLQKDRKSSEDVTKLPGRQVIEHSNADNHSKEMRSIKLRFFHRTVTDFLREDTDGRAVLQPYILTDEDILRACVDVNLVSYKLRTKDHDVTDIANIFKYIRFYCNNDAQTVTSSCVANVIANVIHTVSRMVETEFPADGHFDPHNCSENPGVFELFRASSHYFGDFNRVYAIDLAGLSLQCGCPEYLQEYVVP